jgi:hypothetical protein
MIAPNKGDKVQKGEFGSSPVTYFGVVFLSFQKYKRQNYHSNITNWILSNSNKLERILFHKRKSVTQSEERLWEAKMWSMISQWKSTIQSTVVGREKSCSRLNSWESWDKALFN